MCRLKVASRVMNTHIFERVLPVEKTCLYPILIDPEALGCYARALGIGSTGDVLPMLARAISASPLWRDMPDADLVVRSAPGPALGILGRFDRAGEARLRGLAGGLNDACRRLRYVGYPQAEQDCEQLAARIADRIPPTELARFQFVALPRGGFVVLGMLAYFLGLRRAQLLPPEAPDAPLVVVDDSAFTGLRFSHFLQRTASPRIIFAPLYAHPDLRAAIAAAEPRVEACISARDLQVYRSESPEGAGPASQLGCVERLQGTRYWAGRTDHLCTPWSEPDRGFRNAVTEQWETGWAIVPPELCLKNRPPRGSRPIPVFEQPAGRGPLRPSERVIFGAFEGQVVIGNLATGESFGLAEVAAAMWQGIVRLGNLGEVAAALGREYEVDAATLRADLQAFADDLLARGLLVQDDLTG